MSDNKFILQLKGTQTPKSVVEIKNDKLVAPFVNVPGSSDAVGSIIQDKDSSVVVAKGADVWKLDGGLLVPATNLSGNGSDYTGEYAVSGNMLWVNSTYTFSDTKIFTPNAKWVLQLCGKNLNAGNGDIIDFSFIVKIGSTNIMTKTVTVSEQANFFCKRFVLDFSESAQTTIKAQQGQTLTVQLLCADSSASATIYNGMTVLTALQRRVDGQAVASDTRTFGDIEDELEDIHDDIDDLKDYTDETFVRLDGQSIMTGPLKMAAGSMRGAFSPYLNGVGFWKMDAQGNLTNIANLTDSRFLPVTTNAIDLGRSANKWKDLYLAGKLYVATINNGADLAVPAKSGTLATMGDVELAARSGRMLTDQGVWYAKMYSATVPPAAEDDTNYADFSQVDSDNNPIIVIYTRTSGAWVQSEIITPPADYDGYVPITSKIWDISEQSGQQGGRVLWNHTSKEFTPYPVIISFEDIEVTGESTVIMPYAPSANQIVNKDYVDTLVSNSIGDATITLTQGGQTMGSFTTNQSGDATIALDGGSSYHPDLFDWKWADHILDDIQWLRADTFTWHDGRVYEAAYQHLLAEWNEVGDVPSTEIIAGTQIYYRLAPDGHKICSASQEDEAVAIYEATGVAWYYILDTTNERFKLPRTKFGVTGLRDTVGNYVAPGLPNITGKFGIYLRSDWQDGAFYQSSGNGYNTGGGVYGGASVVGFDASRSNALYGADTTVQPPATQMYLYFYVGEFTQTAIENTAGLNAELFNDKVDVGHQVIAFQAPTAGNNYTWYRKYADGWVEQGGQVLNLAAGAATSAVVFPVEFSDSNYTLTFGTFGSGFNAGEANFRCTAYSATGATFYNNSGSTTTYKWYACGIAAN